MSQVFSPALPLHYRISSAGRGHRPVLSVLQEEEQGGNFVLERKNYMDGFSFLDFSQGSIDYQWLNPNFLVFLLILCVSVRWVGDGRRVTK